MSKSLGKDSSVPTAVVGELRALSISVDICDWSQLGTFNVVVTTRVSC